MSIEVNLVVIEKSIEPSSRLEVSIAAGKLSVGSHASAATNLSKRSLRLRSPTGAPLNSSSIAWMSIEGLLITPPLEKRQAFVRDLWRITHGDVVPLVAQRDPLGVRGAGRFSW